MVAAGFTFLDIWERLGVSMFSWEGMRGIEGNEEDQRQECIRKCKDVSALTSLKDA